MARPLLIGRDEHLAAIARALDRVAAGRAESLVLAGEPGIGKTSPRRGSGSPWWRGCIVTRAERRVGELVAEGFTNPQVAERLFVSRSTVRAR